VVAVGGKASLAMTNAVTHATSEITNATTTLMTASTVFTAGMTANADAIAKATTILCRDMTGLAAQIKKDIMLGFTGITITPHAGIVVDETTLTSALRPITSKGLKT
jgi:hypothetical protein